MPYVRSQHRIDFNSRVDFLLKKARRAQRLRASDSDIRDMVFQCAIFQTSAAIESYIRLLLETWVQKMKALNKGAVTPASSRAYLALRRLDGLFASYRVSGDEKALSAALMGETDLWSFMTGADILPPFFSGQTFHEGASYPSNRNIRRLFGRVGIDNIHALLGRNLSRDVELLIESFQSVRTALAHAAPPAITIADVEARLKDIKALVGAIDRVFFGHVMRHGGYHCW